MITNEKWKKINGYTRYEVSNMGNVRNYYTKKLKAVRKTKTGYYITDLKENGKQKTVYIHRLVAEAFVENAFSLPCVNHIDENKANNCEKNLEWCDVAYNNSYGSRPERMKETKIKRYGKRVAQIDCQTNEILKTYNSITEGAKAIGITKQAIDWSISKANHTAGGFRWVVME